MKADLVKISRYAETFWVGDVREVEPGIFIGTVGNDLTPENMFRRGDAVPFAAREIGETMDKPKPRLSVVENAPKEEIAP